jgi:hypothetical protein
MRKSASSIRTSCEPDRNVIDVSNLHASKHSASRISILVWRLRICLHLYLCSCLFISVVAMESSHRLTENDGSRLENCSSLKLIPGWLEFGSRSRFEMCRNRMAVIFRHLSVKIWSCAPLKDEKLVRDIHISWKAAPRRSITIRIVFLLNKSAQNPNLTVNVILGHWTTAPKSRTKSPLESKGKSPPTAKRNECLATLIERIPVHESRFINFLHTHRNRNWFEQIATDENIQITLRSNDPDSKRNFCISQQNPK